MRHEICRFRAETLIADEEQAAIWGLPANRKSWSRWLGRRLGYPRKFPSCARIYPPGSLSDRTCSCHTREQLRGLLSPAEKGRPRELRRPCRTWPGTERL